MRSRKQSFFRFLIVGATTALASAAALVAFVRYANIDPIVSVALVAIAGNVWGFYANREWSFLVKHGQAWLQFVRYLFVAATSIACSVALFVLLTEVGLHYALASLLVSATFALTNFLAHFHWSFAPTRTWRSRT